MYGIDRSLSGGPVVVSDLVIVTGALVSVVTRHDLSLFIRFLCIPWCSAYNGRGFLAYDYVKGGGSGGSCPLLVCFVCSFFWSWSVFSYWPPSRPLSFLNGP